MIRYRRREFLADVGRGMLVASVGSTLAQDLGLAPAALAEESNSHLTFGAMSPLVDLMESTPADRLMEIVVQKMRNGADLRDFVAAAALANARAFGGQDYDGYHALMALAPAYHMSRELPEAQRALPVLKVLYRNTNHIQQMGGLDHETLHPVAPATLQRRQAGRRDASRGGPQEGHGRGRASVRGPCARLG